jgi:hypothetical protein
MRSFVSSSPALKCTSRLIRSLPTGVGPRNSRKDRTTRSARRMNGASSVAAIKRPGSTRSRNQSIRSRVISGWMISTLAAPASASVTRAIRANQSGRKMRGLKLPTGTMLASPRSGAMRIRKPLLPNA